MQLSVSGHHIDVTDALRNYVTGKFDRLERHYDHITNVHVVLSVEKLEHKAEATVHTSGADLFADSTSGDLYAAIDSLIDKLDRQIVKHKEKVTQRHQRG
ncbi:MAG: ribosome-associated translation inhibitor RaiA [Gammaproteobacteria bacterium]|nr:ribosome-associated translation inhibitor RaiA [Gammaproteobacteria bacterium]